MQKKHREVCIPSYCHFDDTQLTLEKGFFHLQLGLHQTYPLQHRRGVCVKLPCSGSCCRRGKSHKRPNETSPSTLTYVGAGIKPILSGRRSYGLNWTAIYNLFKASPQRHGGWIGGMVLGRKTMWKNFKVHRPKCMHARSVKVRAEQGLAATLKARAKTLFDQE